MTNFSNESQQFLGNVYGVPLPDDFFHFWQFANEINSDDPFNLPINLTLVGPFDVLSGRLDPEHCTISSRMHWRFYKDPPEFLTILCGDVDGLHFGYYYDDPTALPGCVCRYFHNDAYLLANVGNSIFDAVQQYTIECIRGITEWIDTGDYTLEEGQEEITPLQQFLDQLQDYTNRHSIAALPERCITAETWDSMGIVVPSNLYRPLTKIRKVDKLLESQTALQEGCPGTALKFAKDLWSLHDPEWEPHAIALMMTAYSALNRQFLVEVLREHLANRDPALAFINLQMDIWKT